ncbi:MAG: head-tail connector protein [Pseudomonadota bacterium]
MSYLLLSPPAVEPVSLDEARAYLRLEDETEDALVAMLITTARQTCEGFTGRSLISQTWRYRTQAMTAAITLGHGPVEAILTVREASSLASFDWSAGDYALVQGDGRDQLVLKRLPATASRLEIDYRAGYGADWNAVPWPLRQGLLRLIAHAYRYRDDASAPAVPTAVTALWQPYREMHL